ncbi:MAG TPA: EamA family transporter [Thermoanaerobaculia bacterium]|nr:EamA family transporter [Thermoanaerobaculia bacterium]
MSPTALFLLLTAAFLHAAWNLLVRAAGDRLVFSWWSLMTLLPLGLGALLLGPSLHGAWPFILASALLEAAYFALLAVAYGRGDFSLIYPIARGTAPLLLAVGAVAFLGEHLRPLGLLGLLVLASGLAVISGAGLRRTRSGGGVGWALAVALFIALYSLVDGAAVRHFSPLPYTLAVFSLTALLAAPPLLLLRGRQALLAEWRQSWRRIPVVGALSLFSYLLVLGAYQITSVAYAGAVREVSVVVGALAGWRLLGEGFGLRRTVGALLTFSGILLIAIAGR